jgi:hypothetical protein
MKYILIISVLLLSSCSPVFSSGIESSENHTLTFETIIPPAPIQALMPTQATLTSMALRKNQVIVTITPNHDQLINWREYEIALGNVVFPPHLQYYDILCEWDILAQKEQNVYVYVVCSGHFNPDTLSTGSMPAVIVLDSNGDIETVLINRNTPAESFQDAQEKLFPPDVREIINNFKHLEAFNHLSARRDKPEPPLIIINATQIP